MSDNPAEKKQGFERWVASLKLSKNIRSNPPPAAETTDDGQPPPLSLDEQATLINRIPKEVIYKLRERDSNRAMPKSDDSTAVFTPPPELLARARRLEAPPKPERSSPNSSSSPISSREPPISPRNPPISLRNPPISSSAPPLGLPATPIAPRPGAAEVEEAAFASLNSEEEATTYYRPDIAEVPASVPPPPIQELSRPGDIQWIDGLASSPAAPLPQASAPPGGSVAPAERRVRWVAIVVALLLLTGIFVLSRMQ